MLALRLLVTGTRTAWAVTTYETNDQRLTAQLISNYGWRSFQRKIQLKHITPISWSTDYNIGRLLHVIVYSQHGTWTSVASYKKYAILYLFSEDLLGENGLHLAQRAWLNGNLQGEISLSLKKYYFMVEFNSSTTLHFGLNYIILAKLHALHWRWIDIECTQAFTIYKR